MKKSITVLSVAAMLMTGCTGQTSFDPQATQVQVIDGKQFNIPAGATASEHLATKKEIDFYKKSGVSDCRYGDVIWDAKTAQEQVSKAIKEGNPNIHKALVKQGLIGCAHPAKQ
jgi:uncharacterized RmlC-like cupin family protein